jgi:hypothetical protein
MAGCSVLKTRSGACSWVMFFSALLCLYDFALALEIALLQLHLLAAQKGPPLP